MINKLLSLLKAIFFWIFSAISSVGKIGLIAVFIFGIGTLIWQFVLKEDSKQVIEELWSLKDEYEPPRKSNITKCMDADSAIYHTSKFMLASIKGGDIENSVNYFCKNRVCGDLEEYGIFYLYGSVELSKMIQSILSDKLNEDGAIENRFKISKRFHIFSKKNKKEISFISTKKDLIAILINIEENLQKFDYNSVINEIGLIESSEMLSKKALKIVHRVKDEVEFITKMTEILQSDESYGSAVEEDDQNMNENEENNDENED